jgi:hypothetical protein
VLAGQQLIQAQATNDKGTVGKATKEFAVDNEGPRFSMQTPLPGAIVGGVIQVKVTIKDELSGVNDASAIGVFAGDTTHSIKLVREAGTDIFDGIFDVRIFGRDYYLPALSFRADDLLGNHGEFGEEIYVDLTPPMMELDPPLLRVEQTITGSRICSQLFDPVGPESANDGEIVAQVMSVKARVEDAGNRPTGFVVPRISGIDKTTVVLYAMPAKVNGVDQALVVDREDDGPGNSYCDSINPLLVPVSTNVVAANQALALAMNPLVSVGTPNYTFSPSVPADVQPYCDFIGQPATVAPLALCSRSHTGMTYALQNDDFHVGFASIWSIPLVASDAFNCIGAALDSLNHLPEGPTCLAVKASDLAGNTNVSPPLRVCIDRGGGKCTAWRENDPTTWPNCTGKFDNVANQVVAATSCTPLKLNLSNG